MAPPELNRFRVFHGLGRKRRLRQLTRRCRSKRLSASFNDIRLNRLVLDCRLLGNLEGIVNFNATVLGKKILRERILT